MKAHIWAEGRGYSWVLTDLSGPDREAIRRVGSLFDYNTRTKENGSVGSVNCCSDWNTAEKQAKKAADRIREMQKRMKLDAEVPV